MWLQVKLMPLKHWDDCKKPEIWKSMESLKQSPFTAAVKRETILVFICFTVKTVQQYETSSEENRSSL